MCIRDRIIGDLVQRRQKDFRYGNPAHGRVKPSTVNRTVCEAMRCLLNFARKTLKASVLEIDWKEVAPKRRAVRRREISHREEAKITPHLRVGYDVCFRFGILSGLRRHNLTELPWT